MDRVKISTDASTEKCPSCFSDNYFVGARADVPELRVAMPSCVYVLDVVVVRTHACVRACACALAACRTLQVCTQDCAVFFFFFPVRVYR